MGYLGDHCKKKKDCYYGLKDGRDLYMCGYILITGECRGCDASKCDKFKLDNPIFKRKDNFNETIIGHI